LRRAKFQCRSESKHAIASLRLLASFLAPAPMSERLHAYLSCLAAFCSPIDLGLMTYELK